MTANYTTANAGYKAPSSMELQLSYAMRKTHPLHWIRCCVLICKTRNFSLQKMQPSNNSEAWVTLAHDYHLATACMRVPNILKDSYMCVLRKTKAESEVSWPVK